MLLIQIEKLTLVSVRKEDDCVELYFFWALPTAVAWQFQPTLYQIILARKYLLVSGTVYLSLLSGNMSPSHHWTSGWRPNCNIAQLLRLFRRKCSMLFLKTNTTTASPLTLFMSQSVIVLWWETVTIIVSEEISKINKKVKRFGYII